MDNMTDYNLRNKLTKLNEFSNKMISAATFD